MTPSMPGPGEVEKRLKEIRERVDNSIKKFGLHDLLNEDMQYLLRRAEAGEKLLNIIKGYPVHCLNKEQLEERRKALEAFDSAGEASDA